jgi:hypothetical protein
MYSIAGKLFRTDIAVIDSHAVEHSAHGPHHPWWPGQIVDRRLRIFKVFGKHLLINAPRFSLPGTVRSTHVRHGGDKCVARVLPLQHLQFLQKRGIFRPAIRIAEEQTGRQWLSGRSQQDTAERCDADPAGQKHSGPGLVVMKDQVAERSLDLDVRIDRQSS